MTYKMDNMQEDYNYENFLEFSSKIDSLTYEECPNYSKLIQNL